MYRLSPPACLHCFKAKQRLREHLLGRIGAQDLVKVADLHLAGGRSLRRAALFELFAAGSAWLTSSRSACTSSRKSCSSSCCRNCAKACGSASCQRRAPADLVRDCAACEKGGVSISSRYWSFCRPRGSPLRRPIRRCASFQTAEVAERREELVCPLQPVRATKLRMESASTSLS